VDAVNAGINADTIAYTDKRLAGASRDGIYLLELGQRLSRAQGGMLS
jgi:hypothetical protein